MGNICLFNSLNDAKNKGAKGLNSPHVDVISGFDVINYYWPDEEVFICDFDSKGNLVMPTDKFIAFTSSSEQSVGFGNAIGGEAPSGLSFEYSYDKTNWYSFDYSAETILTFGTTEHPYIYFRGNNPDGINPGYEGSVMGQFVFLNEDVKVDISGNIMALINYLSPSLVMPSQSCFAGIFCYNAAIQNISENFLPATGLSTTCYCRMFYGCTSLVTAPCLPAVTLEEQCYSEMFYGCTSLVTAPYLPATHLPFACYSNMFNGCTSLNEIHCNAVTKGENPTTHWVRDVASTGDFYGKTAADWSVTTSGIPTGWTQHLD